MLNATTIASISAMPEPGFVLSNVQPRGACIIAYADPLDEDQETDLSVTMTHRQLARLLFIACETGGQFERERCQTDPVAWLFSPRELFGGSAAVQACQGRSHFIRAMILHGLSIGLDADPEDLDGLMAEESELTFDCQPAGSSTRAGSAVLMPSTA